MEGLLLLCLACLCPSDVASPSSAELFETVHLLASSMYVVAGSVCCLGGRLCICLSVGVVVCVVF